MNKDIFLKQLNDIIEEYSHLRIVPLDYNKNVSILITKSRSAVLRIIGENSIYFKEINRCLIKNIDDEDKLVEIIGIVTALKDDFEKGYLDNLCNNKLINQTTEINYFKLLCIHPKIKKVSEKLFLDKHYSQAILDAFKEVNNLVKKKSYRNDLDGKQLMLTVFSLNKPILKFNDLISQSDKDEQEGYMHLFAGAMQGIRNPKAHDNIIQNDSFKALEYLAFASLLCKKIDKTKKNDII